MKDDITLNSEKGEIKTSNCKIEYRFIYASFNRPINRLWATRLPISAKLVHPSIPSVDLGIPHSWIITESVMSESIISTYELELGWKSIANR